MIPNEKIFPTNNKNKNNKNITYLKPCNGEQTYFKNDVITDKLNKSNFGYHLNKANNILFTKIKLNKSCYKINGDKINGDKINGDKDVYIEKKINTKKKNSSKDRQKDRQKDTSKDRQKDRQKDSQKDRQKDTSKDRQKDSQKDRQKDSQKDRQKDRQRYK